MKNVLVVGGAGFIGSHTVVELAVAGYRPVILDNFYNSDESVVSRVESITKSKVAVYKGSFQDEKLLEKIISTEKIFGVIHFAAYKIPVESVHEPIKYYQNNVSAFLILLKTLLDNGVFNFIFSSSAAVYGNANVSVATEDTPATPITPYGWSKYMDEIVLRDICSANASVKGVALRYFNAVGAHPSGCLGELSKNPPQNLLPLIVLAARGEIPPLTVYGNDYPTPDGTCLRDYIHVVDLAKAHVAALNKAAHQKKGSYDVFNVGTGRPTSVLELIKSFERVNGVKVPYAIGERRAGDPSAFYASVDKAKAELNWKAEKSVEDAVRDTWHWNSKKRARLQAEF